MPMKTRNIFMLCLALIATLHAKAQYTFEKPLYGAAYYHEYMPNDRLDEDIRLMKNAGLTVVRVGESTWGVFEPQEGVFKFEWMDRIIDKMHEAGIQVILGTPTYSIPAWLAYKHPEVLAEHQRGNKAYYGIRQNIDFTNPTFKYYSERIIRKLMERYAQHPGVIGYQVDNETESRGVNNRDYFIGFRNYIKGKFNNNLDLLTKEWGMNYWGMNINTWEEFYTRDGVTNPSYKNEWERYNRKQVADFLNWQCDIVNEYKRKDQFVTHCFMPAFHNIDQVESFRQMQYPAINVYHDVQDKQDGQYIAYAGDFVRTVARNNYIVMETNAQGIGWDARGQYPPYDNQLRQNVYGHYASGANMVEYWHWSTLHYGQETYWRGVLGHDLQPNRIYNEFKTTAGELEKLYPGKFELQLVEGVSHEKAIEIYRGADLIIDQLRAGWFGAFAIECMKMGKPVVAYINHEDLHFVPPQLAKDVCEAFINANEYNLTEVLKPFIEQPSLLLCRSDIVIDFVQRWFDPTKTALITKTAYES